MSVVRSAVPYISTRYLYRLSNSSLLDFHNGKFTRGYAQPAALPQEAPKDEGETEISNAAKSDEEEGGRMSKRLAQITDEAVEQGGRGAEKAIQEAGFSQALKKRLEARIQESTFKSDNPAAYAQVNISSSAGKGTQDIATAKPWSGTEALEDAALRMLNDAHKPLRGTCPPKIPAPRGPPASVDMRMKKAVHKSHGVRLANARDRTSVYALSQDPSLSEDERAKMRKILKERFTAGAQPMPGTVQGLAALANERIEDAIARGQFKNITRGKGTNVERDHNASSPFLDTTEYFMNKIIQKQEIVPPWIEKQQGLVKAAAVFRSGLRADWKRHAARVIASKGGSLEVQIRRAKAYAAAEAANNPKATKSESLTEIDREGRLSQITLTETPALTSKTSDSEITVSEDLIPDPSHQSSIPSQTQSTSAPINLAPPPITKDPEPTPPNPHLPPFRDPAWESLERAYHTLAITSLNSITRSYNLQAPDLAKKPYFSLDRELRACFADIAPQLPDEIRERAKRPEKIKVEVVGHRPGGVLERFSGEKVRVYDSTRPNYGFKQFWRDLWRGQDVKA